MMMMIIRKADLSISTNTSTDIDTNTDAAGILVRRIRHRRIAAAQIVPLDRSDVGRGVNKMNVCFKYIAMTRMTTLPAYSTAFY